MNNLYGFRRRSKWVKADLAQYCVVDEPPDHDCGNDLVRQSASMAFCRMWWPASAAVRRRRSLQSERLVYLKKGLTHQILRGHRYRRTQQPYTRYDIISYSRSAFIEVRKNGPETAASDGFGLNFNDAVFCLPHQLVGLLSCHIMPWQRNQVCFSIVHTSFVSKMRLINRK